MGTSPACQRHAGRRAGRVEVSDRAGDGQRRARLEHEVLDQYALVGTVLGVEVHQWIAVAERDEAVSHRSVGLSHDVAVAVAVPQRGQQPRLGIRLGEEVVDGGTQRRVGT